MLMIPQKKGRREKQNIMKNWFWGTGMPKVANKKETKSLQGTRKDIHKVNWVRSYIKNQKLD